MIERTEQRFGIKPDCLAGDTASGAADSLGWLVDEKDIAPHIPGTDKSERENGTFSREEFTCVAERYCNVCPAGADLPTTGRLRDDDTVAYYARLADCRACPLKSRYCPKSPQRKITRSLHEEACDVGRAIARTKAYETTRRLEQMLERSFISFPS